MAYDEELADRVRALAGDFAREEVTEKRMFGGLAFLTGGNMALAVSGKGGLLARIDPANSADLLDPQVQPAVMGGRELKGWLRVAPAAVTDDADLREWVERCIRYAAALPAKPS